MGVMLRGASGHVYIFAPNAHHIDRVEHTTRYGNHPTKDFWLVNSVIHFLMENLIFSLVRNPPCEHSHATWRILLEQNNLILQVRHVSTWLSHIILNRANATWWQYVTQHIIAVTRNSSKDNTLKIPVGLQHAVHIRCPRHMSSLQLWCTCWSSDCAVHVTALQ